MFDGLFAMLAGAVSGIFGIFGSILGGFGSPSLQELAVFDAEPLPAAVESPPSWWENGADQQVNDTTAGTPADPSSAIVLPDPNEPEQTEIKEEDDPAVENLPQPIQPMIDVSKHTEIKDIPSEGVGHGVVTVLSE